MKKDWTYKKLGEVAEVIGGSTPKTSEPANWEGSNMWVTPAELDGSKYFGKTQRTISDEAASKLQLLPIGTVLFSSRAPIGKVAITTAPMYCNQGFKNIVCGDSLYNEYVYWCLKYNVPLLQSLGVGATFKELSKSAMSGFSIPIPPLSIQHSIVHELDLLHSMIEKKKEQLYELDNLAQSLFYQMFGDPITNPMSWEVKKLGEVGDIVGGSTPKTSDEKNWIGTNQWVSPAELKGDKYFGKTVHTISDEAASKLQLLPKGTVLLSSRAPIGKLAITTQPMYCNQGFKNIVCGPSINNEFVYGYLQLNIPRLQSLGVGATFKEISKKMVESFPIILPPLSLQQSFAAKVSAIEAQKALVRQSIEEARTLLAARMQYYFE